MSNIDDTLKERGGRYGEFTGHAEITQGLKDAMVVGVNWYKLDDDMKEALEMVAHKIGRIVNGDPTYIDSWTDIIGYTRLVEKRLIDEQEAVKGLLKSNVVPIKGDRKFTPEQVAAYVNKIKPDEASVCGCVFCKAFPVDGHA